ncbi:MAG TPA: hypothetical protein VN578_08730 [Candidatus Binatia bacterium]|jgi:hypothetical protein|nr:hypothetical protein [Candidatus Binatia bacterium]
MKQTVQQVLIGYSALLSTILVLLLLTGATSKRKEDFEHIQVHRIDVVEPDGTLRMVIANHERLPGVIVKGKEFPKVDRPEAGMLFYNDEGTENGGLIFGGHRIGNGEIVNSGVSLSFDKYGQGRQIVQLAGVDDKDNKFAGLAVNDQNHRIWVGRKEDGASVVSLMDGNGKKRIVMQVTADGTASLDFLDAEGHVVRQLVPGN